MSKADDDKSTTTQPAAPMKPRASGRVLLVLCEGLATEHPLPAEGSVIVGRGPGADIVVDHPTLSRKHAKLTMGAHVTIEDRGSLNGTFVGGRALRPHEGVLVAPGAPLEVGAALLMVRSRAMLRLERNDNDNKNANDDADASSSLSEGEADILVSTDGSVHARDALERSVERIAQSGLPILLVGEPGTGKEYLAKHIHASSSSSHYDQRPLAIVRCALMLDATELAHTIAMARGGTLILDEPSALALSLQHMLVALLDENASRAAMSPRLRLVTTTGIDLEGAVAQGTLSRALLDRLAGVRLIVPPLRARLRELPQIIESLIVEIASEQGVASLPLVSSDALTALSRRTWPGNVRELRTALVRAMVLGAPPQMTGGKGGRLGKSAAPRVLTATHFDDPAGRVSTDAAGSGVGTLSSAVSEAEHRRIMEALRQCNGNQTRAAKLLGISRGTLVSRLERYQLPRPRK